MHPVSILYLHPLWWHRWPKSLLTIYELGTICKCAKLKLMADLHGDTVGNIRSGDTEGHIKTQTLYGDGHISFCHWNVCLILWSALVLMFGGPTVKTNKWYVSTLPLYLYLSKMCIQLQLKEVWLWEGVKPRTKKLLSFGGISPKSSIDVRLLLYLTNMGCGPLPLWARAPGSARQTRGWSRN